jgi:hypothetical protein
VKDSKMDTTSEQDQYRSSKTIDELPDDVLKLIFTQLNFESTLLCGRVCQRWLEVTSENITFMRKVQLNLELEHESDSIPTLVRTYKVIKIENWLIRGLEIFGYCEQLVLVKCEFINAGHLSHMLADCKRLKTLELHMPRLAAYGDGLEAVENCTKNFPIDLKLTFDNVSSWVILQWFKTINLDISQLQISIERNVYNSEIANMMDYIHQNHRSTFKEFDVILDDLTLSPLFISQIKHLTSFTIIQYDQELLYHICNNLLELRKLKIRLFTELIGNIIEDFNSLLNLESLQIDVFDFNEELILYINELQQLKELKIHKLKSSDSDVDCVLQFDDLRPNQPLCSLTHLHLLNFVIKRNVFQLIFYSMPNLVLLEINKNTCGTQKKRLSQNKNAISRLKNLQTLNIDNDWVDDNFLYNMKLPQLKKFTLLGLAFTGRRPHVNFSQMGLFFLARQCPKLMEITDRNDEEHVIASRKNAACPFNYHFEDEESSDYSEHEYEDMYEESDEPMEPDF